MLTDNHKMVRLLDFGDLEEAMDMRVMAKQFMVLPAQAVNARLAGVMPARQGGLGEEGEGGLVGEEGGCLWLSLGAGWDLGLELLIYQQGEGDGAVGDGHVHSKYFLINLCRHFSDIVI